VAVAIDARRCSIAVSRDKGSGRLLTSYRPTAVDLANLTDTFAAFHEIISRLFRKMLAHWFLMPEVAASIPTKVGFSTSFLKALSENVVDHVKLVAL